MSEDIPDRPLAPPAKRRPPRGPKDLTREELAKAITATEERMCRLIHAAVGDTTMRMRACFQVRDAAEKTRAYTLPVIPGAGGLIGNIYRRE